MLVLTRRITKENRDTDILVTCPNGDVIKISLVQISGKQVRIGVETPNNAYHIDRAEVYHENQAKRDNCPNRLITTPSHANLLK